MPFAVRIITVATSVVCLTLVAMMVYNLTAELVPAVPFAVLAGAGFYYLLSGMSVLAVFVRAILALVPIGGAAALILLQFVNSDWLDDGETRALIAATVVAAGWIVAFVTGEWRQANAEQERRRDMIRAAITEIELIASFGQRADWDDLITRTEKNFHLDRRYSVFIFYGHQFSTLKRLVEQVEILAKHQIRPTMDFFQLLDRLERMESKMSSDAFRDLPWERRQEAVIRYLRMQSEVPNVALQATKALKDRPFHGILRRMK